MLAGRLTDGPDGTPTDELHSGTGLCEECNDTFTEGQEEKKNKAL